MPHPKRPDQTWLEWDAEHGAEGQVDPAVYQRYLDGTATNEDLIALVKAGEITVNMAQEYGSALGQLEDDLVGLTPVVEPDPRTTPGTPLSIAKPGQETPYYQDAYGELYDRSGNPITEAQRKRLLGAITGADDPYAAAADARDAARLAEQVRAQRIREAQDAADAIQQRLQAAQAARLEGARFSVTPSMAASGGYFPGLQPDSPIVRQGLADPFQFQPQAFNPERGVNLDEQQIARDLQMIRSAAGQGS